MVFFLTLINHIDHSTLYLVRNNLNSQLCSAVIVEISHFLQLIALRHVGQLAGIYITFSVCQACCPNLPVRPDCIIFLAEINYIDKAADSGTVLAVVMSAVSSVVVISAAPMVIMIIIVVVIPAIIIPAIVVIIVVIVIPTVIVIIIVVPAILPPILPVVPVVRSCLRLQDAHLASRHYKRCCKQ